MSVRKYFRQLLAEFKSAWQGTGDNGPTRYTVRCDTCDNYMGEFGERTNYTRDAMRFEVQADAETYALDYHWKIIGDRIICPPCYAGLNRVRRNLTNFAAGEARA